MELENGRVKFFKVEKRHGFLRTDAGDVFFHMREGRCFEERAFEPALSSRPVMVQPKQNDLILFKRGSTREGPKALLWGFGNDFWNIQHSIDDRSTPEHMIDVVRHAKPSERLRLFFADAQGEELRSLLRELLGMNIQTLLLDSPSKKAFGEALAAGRWEGSRAWSFSILPGFNRERFVETAIKSGLLTSIAKSG